jgi:hypothetical protein
MQLKYPPGLKSKYDPQTLESMIDYSLLRPLSLTGSDYPCHGYATPAIMNPLSAVANLTANTAFKISIDGTAVHAGGSCQMSISYDNGASFAVLASIIGGCPLTPDYVITLPDLPSKKRAIFAWNWFNQVSTNPF